MFKGREEFFEDPDDNAAESKVVEGETEDIADNEVYTQFASCLG